MLRNMCLWVVVLASILLFAECGTAPQPVQKSDTAAGIQAIDALRNQFETTYNSHEALARQLVEGLPGHVEQ